MPDLLTEFSALQKQPHPVKLFRLWKKAAGPLFGNFIPAAPFSALAGWGFPPLQPLYFDKACRELGFSLNQSLEGETVRAGEAAFVVDLSGPVSIGTGFYLQHFSTLEYESKGISPVLLFGGLWRPEGVLAGHESATSLNFYGEKLKGSKSKGFAFLLERERNKKVAPLKLVETFDNRYRAGFGLLPPPEFLASTGIKALIDLRLATDSLPEDLTIYYEAVSKKGFDIFQTRINL